jgi:hypothetical protein
MTLGSGIEPEPTRPRSGADDETTRRNAESDGEEDQLAVGGRDHRGNAAHNADMPISTIERGNVDFELSVAEIAHELTRIARDGS